MKKLILILILIPFIISCDNSKKYQGRWTNYYLHDYWYNETRSIKIENDSIKLYYPYVDYCNTYSLKIKNNVLSFNGLSFKVSMEGDTLLFNESILFVKDGLDTLYRYKPILKIKLPEIPTIENSKNNKLDPFTYIYFGKRLDNNKYGLQLNDRHADFNEIPRFLAMERASIREEVHTFYTTVLIIDKSAPLKYVESIFHELKKVNQLKIKLVNTLDIDYSDKVGLYYNYEGLDTKLPYFTENDFYVPNTLKGPHSPPPPPPPPYFPFFGDQNPEPQFILLKNNTLFHNDKTISTSELKTLTQKWVKNKNAIFSLYDLESNYGKFLEMTAIINSVYQNERNTLSKGKFNKSLDELIREEMTSVKQEIPMYHVWSFSIPHFNHVVQQKNNTFGINLSAIH